jgi:hypothetical protein
MDYQEIIAGTVGKENTFGTCVGRVKAGAMSYARYSTDDRRGVIRGYTGAGKFTDDPLETFGGAGVAEIPQLQKLLKYICREGFEHHVAANFSDVSKAVHEAAHEAAGVVVEAGSEVRDLKPGDRVCMEPGIPDMSSRASREGHYNLDPAVRFWATPPIHGCLTGEVVHPAAFTFKLPAHVSLAEGAMVEPFAVGMHAATKAQIKPGATAVVIGAGPIGIMVALSALAAGAGQVIISDLSAEKLAIAGKYQASFPSTFAAARSPPTSPNSPPAGAPTSSLKPAEPRKPSKASSICSRPLELLCSSACRPAPSPSTWLPRRPRKPASKPSSATPMFIPRPLPCSPPARSISSRSSRRAFRSNRASPPSSAPPKAAPPTSSCRSLSRNPWREHFQPRACARA